MMRATVTSVIDQALLSALNFGIAAALIFFASKEDYGLYSQVVNLQSLFSPLHAGIFVSAFLAIGSRKNTLEYQRYRTNMVWAEIVITALSTVAVAVLTYAGLRLAGTDITWSAAVASAMTLLGLWWREFARQHHFARAQYAAVLRIDGCYAALVMCALGISAASDRMSSTTVFWCLGVAGALAASSSLLAAMQRRATIKDIATSVSESWYLGRWDVLGSFATWGYAQSYLYLAAIQGGLGLVAEISASRLLAMPLPLLWASYANVLRPSASHLFEQGDLSAVRRLAVKAVGIVVALSACYALALLIAFPLLRAILEEKGFAHLDKLAIAWIVYFSATGVTTVAASILRSALAFRAVFVFQLLSCIAALVVFTVSFRFASQTSLVVALTIVELFSAALLWRDLWQRTNLVTSTLASAPST